VVKHGLSRRRLLGDTTRAACGAAIAGALLALFARQAHTLPSAALRPPGALPEEDFAAACLRCGLCVRACPFDTLSLADWADEAPNGTPFFVAREIPCEMCEDVPCVGACPSGALDPTLTRIDDARMGLAVLVDQENCLNMLGLRCDVCYRVCPLIDEAITLDPEHNVRTGAHARFVPVVHSEHCTGCGKCEHACVLDGAAIKVLPLALARGQPGAHYRLGWVEKERAGQSLVPQELELPARRPEEGPL
jgi:ferredoxin-type protein NapG